MYTLVHSAVHFSDEDINSPTGVKTPAVWTLGDTNLIKHYILSFYCTIVRLSLSN